MVLFFLLIMVTMHIAHNNRPDSFTCSSQMFILHSLHAWPLLFVHLSGHVCYLIISPFLSCLRCMRVCVCVCSGYVCLVSVGSIGTRTPPFTPSTFNCFLADSHICAAARFWLRLTRLRTGYVYPDCEQTDAERSFGTVKTEQFRLTYSFVCTFQQ